MLISCRYCDAEFTPSMSKPGYWDVCHRCTEIELAANPDLEPEPLVAGPSIDEAGTFDQIGPASRMPRSVMIRHALAETMEQREDHPTQMRTSKRRK